MLPFILLLLLTITYPVKPQLDFISPCPQVFIYEVKSKEPDKWYGVVTLLRDVDYVSTQVQLIFDRPSLEFGNWLGRASSEDNIKYFVNNETNKITAYIPQLFRFYVKYDPNKTPPKLVSIHLNAKIICPEEELTEQDTASPIPPQSLQPRPETGSTNPSGGSHAEVEDDLKNICGTVVPQATPLTTYGFATEEGEFPWHAALYHTTIIQTRYVCGGSLVSKLHIVTAAHCVTRRNPKAVLSAENVQVVLGKYNLMEASNPNIQRRQVSRITPHPEFSAKNYSNNIAVIKLSAPVQITDYVRPICLWQDSTDLNLVVNKQGIVAGWGFDETGKPTEKLRKVIMPVVSLEDCISSYPEFYSRFLSNKNYCAGFANGTSVCNGDSGGGMIFPSMTTSRPVFQLRGIVSVSVALQNQSVCDTSQYVVFTDAAKYLDWIENVINNK